MRFSKMFTAAVAVSMPVAAIASATPSNSHADIGALVARQADLAGSLGDLVDLLQTLSGFLTEEFFSNVQIVVNNLAATLADPLPAQARKLVSTANTLLDTLSPVLDTFLNLNIDIEGIATAVASLLTVDTINKISNLLNKAASLLTQDFIDQTQGLIADVAPLISAVSEFITALITALLG